MTPVDMATHPYLSGRFAPIHDEVEVDQLEVEGSLPEGLVGAYLRNGPNQMFPPLGSYTYLGIRTRTERLRPLGRRWRLAERHSPCAMFALRIPAASAPPGLPRRSGGIGRRASLRG